MKTRSAFLNFRKLCVFLSLWLFLLSAGAQAQNGLPPAVQEVGIEQRLNQQIPLDLEFVDENGRLIKLGDYFKGKPVILSLVYYECPMLCTYVLNGLVSSLKTLSFEVGNEFEVITLSFDPQETPALAKKKKAVYVREYSRQGADPGWHFLTGNEQAIQKLTKAVGFKYKYDSNQDQYAHASGIMVLTPEGRLSRYFYGVEYSARDIRLALVEASQNKIGSMVDQVLLFCFHYDPTQGKYSAYAINFMRLGGLVTVLCLGIFILRMKRKEERQVVRKP